MILIYAFTNQWGTNVSRRTLLDLQKLLPSSDINYQLIHFHPKVFFQKYLRNNHYQLIIGLGDFYGDSSKIRLETQAHNRYGEQSINPYLPINLELSLPTLDYLDTQKFTVSEHMGKYNCNWIAFQIQSQLLQQKLPTAQIFLHLPKKGTSSKLAHDILTLLKDNSLV